MSGSGHEYSTKAAVTAPPSTADFAFHFSEATRRKDEPHGAEFAADTSGLFSARFLGLCGGGFGGRRFGSRSFGSRDAPRRGLGHQFRRLQPLGRFPQAFQTVELARFLRENMDDEVHVVEQHP